MRRRRRCRPPPVPRCSEPQFGVRETRAEALEQADLLVIELNGLLPVGFLEAQQAVVFGEQVVTLPHATHTTRTDIDALQSQFLGDPQRAMSWSGERVIEDGLLNLPGATRLGCAPLQPGSLSSKPSAP